MVTEETLGGWESQVVQVGLLPLQQSMWLANSLLKKCMYHFQVVAKQLFVSVSHKMKVWSVWGWEDFIDWQFPVQCYRDVDKWTFGLGNKDIKLDSKVIWSMC